LRLGAGGGRPAAGAPGRAGVRGRVGSLGRARTRAGRAAPGPGARLGRPRRTGPAAALVVAAADAALAGVRTGADALRAGPLPRPRQPLPRGPPRPAALPTADRRRPDPRRRVGRGQLRPRRDEAGRLGALPPRAVPAARRRGVIAAFGGETGKVAG